MKIAIYKVCDSSGACLYAGQTAKPKARFSQHRRKFKNAVCKIVKWVKSRDGCLEERKLILRLKRIGQAKHNVVIPNETPFLNRVSRLRVGETFYIENDSQRVQQQKRSELLLSPECASAAALQ